MKRFAFLSLLCLIAAGRMYAQTAVAYVAGGCFWCVESDYEKKLDGIIEVESGYIGTGLANPTYKDVSAGKGRYREATKIMYDASKLTYEDIVSFLFTHIDPFDARGQFCDRGFHYTAAVYFEDDDEKATAEAVKARYEQQLGQEIVTAIEPLTAFTRAEGYHQDYYKTNSLRYNYYRTRCQRDARVNQVWRNIRS